MSVLIAPWYWSKRCQTAWVENLFSRLIAAVRDFGKLQLLDSRNSALSIRAAGLRVFYAPHHWKAKPAGPCTSAVTTRNFRARARSE